MTKSDRDARTEKHAEEVGRKMFGTDGKGVGREIAREKPSSAHLSTRRDVTGK